MYAKKGLPVVLFKVDGAVWDGRKYKKGELEQGGIG